MIRIFLLRCRLLPTTTNGRQISKTLFEKMIKIANYCEYLWTYELLTTVKGDSSQHKNIQK